MYDYILMKLPQDVVMSVRALVSAIEADPVKQEQFFISWVRCQNLVN